MKPSPYAPPRSSVADPRPDTRRGSTLLAILGGVGVDLALTESGLFAYGLVASADTIGDWLAAYPVVDESVALVIGLGATVAGGFAAAWIANRREIAHGALFGVATLVVAEVMLQVPALMPEAPPPFWRQLVWFTLAVPAGMAGAALRVRLKRRDAALEAPAGTLPEAPPPERSGGSD